MNPDLRQYQQNVGGGAASDAEAREPLSADARRRLREARVLLVGAGGLGSPAALYLTAAGVGALHLVDFDCVDVSNLQRQVLFSNADVGRPKLTAARERLRGLNPAVQIDLEEAPFGPGNGARLVAAADVVVDGSDNFATRYLVNDACVLAARANVFGSIQRFEGQASVFAAPGGPCYRCLHPEPPPEGLIPSCAEGGVLGVLPGVIGAIQAMEAIKIIAGIGEPLIGRFLLYEALRMRIREIALPRDPACPACGDEPVIRDLRLYPGACLPDSDDPTISVEELASWRSTGRPHLLLDVREPDEHAAANIPGARLVPLASLDVHAAHLASDAPIVVHCRTGIRSARAAARLRRRGLDARSLEGGLEAWQRRTGRVP